jgi:hypothetical protein
LTTSFSASDQHVQLLFVAVYVFIIRLFGPEVNRFLCCIFATKGSTFCYISYELLAYIFTININMNVEFENTTRPLVYSLKLETDYTSDILLQELEKENWQLETFKNVNGRQGGKRYTINGEGRYASKAATNAVSSPVLQDLLSYSMSRDFKTKWLSTMINTPAFCKLWGTSDVDRISSYTVIHANYLLDTTMAKIGLHLDNRLLVATGMIYLNESDSNSKPLQATTFYTDENKSNPLTILPNFGTGWVAANTHNSWHEGYNLSNQKRYSLLLGISIDVTGLQKS